MSRMSRMSNKLSHRLHFEGSIPTCRECPLRDGCVSSKKVNRPKSFRMNVPKAVGDEIAKRLRKAQLVRRRERWAQFVPSGRPRRASAGPALVLHPLKTASRQPRQHWQGASSTAAAPPT